MMIQRNCTLLLLVLFFSTINQSGAFEPVTQDPPLDLEKTEKSLFSFQPQRLLASLKRFYDDTTTNGISGTPKGHGRTTATRTKIGQVVKGNNPKQASNSRITIFAHGGSTTQSKAPASNMKATSYPTTSAVATTLGSVAVTATAAPTPSRGSSTSSSLRSSTATSTRASGRIKTIAGIRMIGSNGMVSVMGGGGMVSVMGGGGMVFSVMGGGGGSSTMGSSSMGGGMGSTPSLPVMQPATRPVLQPVVSPESPTEDPTTNPTIAPSIENPPTATPISPTKSPTVLKTKKPAKKPTKKPSKKTTKKPTMKPSPKTKKPTIAPSKSPSTTQAPNALLTAAPLVPFRLAAESIPSLSLLRAATQKYLTDAFASQSGFVEVVINEIPPFFRRANRDLQTEVILYLGGTVNYLRGSDTTAATSIQVAALSDVVALQTFLDLELGTNAPQVMQIDFAPTQPPSPPGSPTNAPTIPPSMSAPNTSVPVSPTIPPTVLAPPSPPGSPTNNPTIPPSTSPPNTSVPASPTIPPTVLAPPALTSSPITIPSNSPTQTSRPSNSPSNHATDPKSAAPSVSMIA